MCNKVRRECKGDVQKAMWVCIGGIDRYKAALPPRLLGGGMKEHTEQKKEFCTSCKTPIKSVLLISSTPPQTFVPIYPNSMKPQNLPFLFSTAHLTL